jgi:hypothetical protein
MTSKRLETLRLLLYSLTGVMVPLHHPHKELTTLRIMGMGTTSIQTRLRMRTDRTLWLAIMDIITVNHRHTNLILITNTHHISNHDIRIHRISTHLIEITHPRS